MERLNACKMTGSNARPATPAISAPYSSRERESRGADHPKGYKAYSLDHRRYVALVRVRVCLGVAQTAIVGAATLTPLPAKRAARIEPIPLKMVIGLTGGS